MKKINYSVYSLGMRLCMLTLGMTTRQACLWFTCQPKEPLDLREKDLKDLW